MLKKQIKIGSCYRAKVSGNIVTVQIISEHQGSTYRGWNAKNLYTGRMIFIKSAAKLRSEVSPFEAEREFMNGNES